MPFVAIVLLGVCGAVLYGILQDLVTAHVCLERHVAFLADLWVHNAAYLVGVVGGLGLVVRVWQGRRQPAGAVERPAAHDV